jgi:uncharacterized protein (UPF0548 family)
MFLLSRPSDDEIEQYLKDSQSLPLSYEPGLLAREIPSGFKIDECSGLLGKGKPVFELARDALVEWRQFDLGWVELFPRSASIEPGTVVAVLIRHVGIWSLNGCRVLYLTGDRHAGRTFGFAYGTLTNHGEIGEELFEVSIDPDSEAVSYKIRAVSKPGTALARLGYPLVRLLQARFRNDSIAAMQKAVKT